MSDIRTRLVLIRGRHNSVGAAWAEKHGIPTWLLEKMHEDVGVLLDEIDRLRKIESEYIALVDLP